MIKNVVQDIGGVGIYGIVSMCLFFTVFTGAVIWGFLHKASFCARMSALPLHDGTISKGNPSHE